MKSKVSYILFCPLFSLLLLGCNGSDTRVPTNVTEAKKDNPSKPQDTTAIINGIDCPLQGSAKTEKLQELNIRKNRTNFPDEKDYNTNITLAALLKTGDDRERWSTGSAARIIGYVRDVKPGGVETTNCKAKEKNLRDTHIELVLNPMSAEKKESFIVEITPRLRKLMVAKGQDWSTASIRDKYLGRWVRVEGWMLFDFEHANMAENTHSGNIGNWRGSAWEVHPVTKIEIVEKH